MDLTKWKKEVDDTIKILEKGNVSTQNAILLNSLYGLKKKWNKEEKRKNKVKSVSDSEKHNDTYVNDYSTINKDFDYTEYINEELNGADTYLNLWLQNKDEELKKMALQELSHCEYWVEKARENNALTDNELKEIKIRHGSLLAKLS